MIVHIRQFVAYSVLFALAWSCFGLNFGMLGEEMSMHNTSVMSASQMGVTHVCCGLSTSNDASEGNFFVNHHTSIPATLVSFDMLLVVLLFVSFTFALLAIVFTKTYERCRLYMKQWQEQRAYFALFFSHLFSSGILHSKTW
ncbi:MAG: hypothetical protein COU32_01875 [Candidatus Magasanikbacteria bacterium CG10_big_fil_rev_8_21_14_0_10_42_10]|uniref:Uncharacterized protein n=1 Tax=Candidatus Magasanikbacteria bacterium CG10_big_fil_rev_8_21_14_0_10_42_10 TaxID=1974649 RepID=A0A2H0TYL5_9BACT|nr:MAG: hypothetical protein COU32_01875 [Candidatus Magasanikbacteria bacterium CG10_big_fil_rev_8_21_14_0_10_42_10]